MVTRLQMPVYAARVRRGRRRQLVHVVDVQLWRDDDGTHRALDEQTLCGVAAARYTENSTTPITCPRCATKQS